MTVEINMILMTKCLLREVSIKKSLQMENSIPSGIFSNYSQKFGLVHNCISSLREEVWAHETSLTLPFLIEVPVPSQKTV